MRNRIFILLIILLPCALFLVKQRLPTKEQKKFSRIYNANEWHQGSGPGSVPKNAKPYIVELQKLINQDDINTIYDLGCGDWQLMSVITIPKSKYYYGFDVVQSVIEKDTQLYKENNLSFKAIRNFDDFTKNTGDLLIVKDVLMHLPNNTIEFFIKNILPNFKYTIITNDIAPWTLNKDINVGHFRAVDLEKAPFNLKGNIKTLIEFNAHDDVIKRTILYTNPDYSAKSNN